MHKIILSVATIIPYFCNGSNEPVELKKEYNVKVYKGVFATNNTFQETGVYRLNIGKKVTISAVRAFLMETSKQTGELYILDYTDIIRSSVKQLHHKNTPGHISIESEYASLQRKRYAQLTLKKIRKKFSCQTVLPRFRFVVKNK